MTNYHFNTKTGKAGTCSAKPGKCPFGDEDEHFDSPEEALEAYENDLQDFYNLKTIPVLDEQEVKRFALRIEKNNLGDRAEPMIVAQMFLKGKFEGKEIKEAYFSDQQYIFKGKHPNHKIFIKQPNGNLTEVKINTAVWLDSLDQISNKGSAEAEAEVLNQMGFNRKRPAKAESWSKADVHFVLAGKEKVGVSIKSDLAAAPTLTGASQESRLTIALKPAGNMTRAEFARVLDEISQETIRNKPMVPGKNMITLLQERGVVIDMKKSHFASEAYRNSLKEIHPNAEFAMKDMVISYISDRAPSQAFEDERATIFHEYATRRNTTGLVDEDKRATHFASLRSDKSLETQKISKETFKRNEGGAIKIEAASSKTFIHVNEERMPVLDEKETVAYFPYAISGRMK